MTCRNTNRRVCSELEKDVTQAGRDGDLAKVRQIRDELRNGVWATPPPVTLVERVEATYAELDRGRARLELASLEQA